MKTGKSLVQMAKILEDYRENSRDYLVPTAKLSMDRETRLVFTNGDRQALIPTNYAHGQLASYTGIPKVYYDRLREEAPEILGVNVNHGLEHRAITEPLERSRSTGKAITRLVRTHKESVRAFLSSSYRRLDSYDMVQTVLPLLIEGEFDVLSSEITETRTYIKAVTKRITSEVMKGDAVQYGLLISNSDVGAGSVRVEPLVYRLVCLNGMVSTSAIKKFHLGRNMASDDVTELLTDETLSLSDKAFWSQIRDIVTASMRPEMFETEVNRLREASQQKITNFDLPDVVELSMRTVGVDGQGTRDNIVAYLANGADGAGLTKWGLINGFTHAAQSDDVSYDQSVELERAASRLLDLNVNQWRRIAASTPV